MGAVKWIKIVTDIFDDEKMLLLESLPDSDSIIVIWFKLLCLAGKNNNSGVFLLNDKIPYTDEMLAIIFRKEVDILRFALKTFKEFGMIEIIDNVITIPNWSKHQTLDAYEKRKERDRIYQREKRAKQKLLITATEVSTDNSTDVVVLEKEAEEEKDNISKDILSSSKLLQVIEAWNKLCLSKLLSIKPNTNRYNLLKSRIKEVGIEVVIETINSINNSNFLRGENDRGWCITFDWFIKPNNFIKVLEGNYLNKEVKDSGEYINRKSNNRWSAGKNKSFNVNTESKYKELSAEDKKRAEELI